MICTATPPSSVIFWPPSMPVFLLLGSSSVAVTRMVTGASPQLKVMTPPLVAAACSWVKVQLSALPVPTTVVGVDTLAGWPFAGTPALHELYGLPALQVVPPSIGIEPPVPMVVLPAVPPVALPPVPTVVLPAVPPVALPPVPLVVLPAAPPVPLLPVPLVVLPAAPPVPLLPVPAAVLPAAPPVAALPP